jgi:hypothetical protein
MKTRAAILATAAAVASLFCIGSAVPAHADVSYAYHCYWIDLKAPDGTTYRHALGVDVYFETSHSGASVRATHVDITNFMTRSATVDVDRWQSDDGAQVQRGYGGSLNPSSDGTHAGGTIVWFPTLYINFSNNPRVYVHAYATTRPGLGGEISVYAKPFQDSYCAP